MNLNVSIKRGDRLIIEWPQSDEAPTVLTSTTGDPFRQARSRLDSLLQEAKHEQSTLENMVRDAGRMVKEIPRDDRLAGAFNKLQQLRQEELSAIRSLSTEVAR